MFGMAGLAGDPEYLTGPKLTNCRIVKVAQEMFGKWVKGDKSAIHPDLRGAIFAMAIKNGGTEEVVPHETRSLIV